MFFCVIRGTEPNISLKEEDFVGKTVSDISAHLKLTGANIFYKNSFYCKLLDQKCVPLTEYPDMLVQKRPEKYPPPPSHLCILPNSNESDLILYFGILTQMDVTFPTLGLSFTNKEIDSLKISDVLSRCISTFGYQSSECKLTQGEEVLNGDQPAKSYLLSAVTNRIVFHCVVSDDAQKKIKHRIFQCQEIFRAEKIYIEYLDGLLEFWEPEIANARLFDEQNYRMIFRDIPIIKNSHSVFLASLETEEGISFSMEFGYKFLLFVQFFKLSATFVSQYKMVNQLINDKMKNRDFKNKFKEIEKKSPTGKDFLQYYTTPVQQYPRYPLLVKDLNKQTPNFHPDKPYLAAAYTALEVVNKEIDHSSYRMKQLEQMEAIQKQLGKSLQIINPGRELIAQTPCRFIKPKLTTGQIFLFTDIVMIATTNKKALVPVYVSQIINFRFANCRPSQDSILFFDDDKENLVQIPDAEARSNWMESLAKCRETLLANVKSTNSILRWTDLQDVDDIPAIMYHNGCFVNGSAIFYCAFNMNTNPQAELVKYSPQSSAWIRHQSPVPPREYATVNSIGSSAYVCFGQSKVGVYNDIWKYEETSNEWTQMKLFKTDKNDQIVERYGHTCVAYLDFLVVFGGKSKSGKYLNDILIYNTVDHTIATYKFQNDTEAPCPRAFHAATLVGEGNMIIVGGRNNNTTFDDVYTFEILKQVWHHEVHTGISPRYGHKLTSAGRFCFVIGGIHGDKSVPSAVIDIENMEVVPVDQFGNIPYMAANFAAVALDHYHILIYGGCDESKYPTASTYVLDATDFINKDLPIKKKEKPRSQTTIEVKGSPVSVVNQPLAKNTPSQRSFSIIQPTSSVLSTTTTTETEETAEQSEEELPSSFLMSPQETENTPTPEPVPEPVPTPSPPPSPEPVPEPKHVEQAPEEKPQHVLPPFQQVSLRKVVIQEPETKKEPTPSENTPAFDFQLRHVADKPGEPTNEPEAKEPVAEPAPHPEPIPETKPELKPVPKPIPEPVDNGPTLPFQVKLRKVPTKTEETKPEPEVKVNEDAPTNPFMVKLRKVPPKEEPAPKQEPELTPAPAPKPEPTPAPTPKPEPTPVPKPEPVVEPKPEPVPTPKPEPVIAPKPEPVPEPKPAPAPEPVAEPVQPKPAPKQEAKPIQPIAAEFNPGAIKLRKVTQTPAEPPKLLEEESSGPVAVAGGDIPYNARGNFSEGVMYKAFNIDTSGLLPFEQAATKIKARRVWQIQQSNQLLMDKIAELEKNINGASSKDFYLAKVMDDSSKVTKIIKLSKAPTIDEVVSAVSSTIQREAKISILSGNEQSDLNESLLSQMIEKAGSDGIIHAKLVAI